MATGGDGTANEVINGLMQAKQAGVPHPVAMGVLAIGRGNDFAYGMGIPPGVAVGCDLLALNGRHVVDIGWVTGGLFPNGRYFGNGLGIGFDTIVGFEAAKLPLTGLPAYAVAALKTILLYAKGSILEVTLENGADKKVLNQQFIMVSVMNGRRLGGGFMTAPDGITDDGLFDVCIVDQITRRHMLALIPRFLKGTQGMDPAVNTYRAQRLHVRAVKGTIPAHVDGETVCEAGQSLSLEIHSRQLEMVTSITSKGSLP